MRRMNPWPAMLQETDCGTLNPLIRPFIENWEMSRRARQRRCRRILCRDQMKMMTDSIVIVTHHDACSTLHSIRGMGRWGGWIWHCFVVGGGGDHWSRTTAESLDNEEFVLQPEPKNRRQRAGRETSNRQQVLWIKFLVALWRGSRRWSLKGVDNM